MSMAKNEKPVVATLKQERKSSLPGAHYKELYKEPYRSCHGSYQLRCNDER